MEQTKKTILTAVVYILEIFPSEWEEGVLADISWSWGENMYFKKK
jgi:Zn-dependent M32 family carboxypeptidase